MGLFSLKTISKLSCLSSTLTGLDKNCPRECNKLPHWGEMPQLFHMAYGVKWEETGYVLSKTFTTWKYQL